MPSASPVPLVSDPNLSDANRRMLLRWAISLLLILLVLIVCLYVFGGDVFRPQHRFGLYAAITVFSGLVFCFFTPSTGEFSIPNLGLRLGGGAAIGLGIVYAINFIIPWDPPPSLRVITTDGFPTDSPYFFDKWSSGIRSVMVEVKKNEMFEGSRRFGVEFEQNQTEGELYFYYFDADRDGRVTRTQPVVRTGPLPEATESPPDD